MPALLLAIALLVGCCVGAVGVGGILLVPSLALLVGIPIHEAAATALFTFLFTGLYGTWLFHRRGSIDWRTSIPVCAGSVVFSYVGAWANSAADTTLLTRAVALVTLATGAYILWPGSWRTRDDSTPRSPAGLVPLTCIGAAAGFGAGLSGAGGPLFSVPLMLAFGFAPLTAIGTGGDSLNWQPHRPRPVT